MTTVETTPRDAFAADTTVDTQRAAVGDRTDQGTAQPFNQLDMVGMSLMGLMGLGGLWMILAPFLVGSQARGAQWTAGTTDDVVVGAVVAIIAIAAVIAVVAGGLRALARMPRRTEQA